VATLLSPQVSELASFILDPASARFYLVSMKNKELIERITCNPDIFGGKPIVRGHRLAVEHVLDMLAAGDDAATILGGYPWLEPADIQACLLYASLLARHERIEIFPTALAS
jgi:uncharacterized protein (DUF433 family)